MKTIFYLIAFCFCIQFNIKAQSNYQIDEFEPGSIVMKNDCDKLKPVYYNFTRRRLYASNKMPLNGQHFLQLCRGINDDRIQLQINRYDQLTKNKKNILGAMFLCGIGGFIGMVASTSMIGSSSYGYDQNNGYAVLGVSAAALFVATPILAISTGIPHQKRKAILFHDLPEAYNFYVTTQTIK